VRPKMVCGVAAADELEDFDVGSLIKVFTSRGAGGASTGGILGGSPSGRFFFSHHISVSMGRCRSTQAFFAARRPSMVQILHWLRAEFNGCVKQ
jgi:hypothetical protein